MSSSHRRNKAIATLTIALACTTVGLYSPSARAAQPEPSRRPNILFLLTDDQRFDTLGCMGNEIIQTPHLDRLAAEGVVFNNAFVTTSVCAHSRASFFTGQYCARHGMTRFFLKSPFGPNLTDSRVGWEFTAEQAALTARWKYIRFVDTQPLYEELYDLSADPDEAHNLAGDPKFRAVLGDMRVEWAEWHGRVRQGVSPQARQGVFPQEKWINTKSFPFGQEVGTRGSFSFPKELIVGPVDLKREQVSQPTHEVKVERNVRIPMRDGVSLAAEVYRPDASGRFPALMTLVYYPTGAVQAQFFARHGYVCVVVNVRGRNGSEGEWEPYVNEPQDGYDTQQWIGRQPWCNGKIGMYGQSYNAFTQIASAPMASPHLKCILPLEGQQTNFGHLYNDGVPQLNVMFTFGLYATGPTRTGPHIPIGPHYLQLPLMSAADKADNPQAQRLKTWLEHSSYDDYWKSYGVKEKYLKVQAPAWFATGWYDNLVHEGWRNFKGFREQGGSEACRQGTRIRVGGGVHGRTGVDLPMHLRWYDYWLKGFETGIDKEPPIEIFVMGANVWRHEHQWPLARTQFTKYYLRSGGTANTLEGDGRLSTNAPPADAPPDQYTYDPADPVYTLGGQMSTHRDIWGPKDRRERQTRRDVLVYTTEPLAADTEVTGPVELKLFAASSAVDTDFTATLTDVHPDGQAIHICEGIRRASFRESLENPTPIEPGEIYEYTISLWETSMVFKAGHRIRLEVSSSNFPRYARNLNTGLPLGTSDEMKEATQTVFHDARHASHLVLPIIPNQLSEGNWDE